MKRALTRLAVLLLVSSPVVFAYQNKTFLWTPPTQYEDGSPLIDSEITGYNIFCKESAAASPTLLGTVTNTGGTTQWTSPDGSLPPGTYDCHATTLTADSESQASNTVNFTVPQAQPDPPTGFSVTIP
jgi:hypothetical protein